MRKPTQEGQRRSTFARLVLSILAAVAMIATGGVVAAAHAPSARAAGTSLTCGTGVVYGVSQITSGNETSGQLVQYTPSVNSANPSLIGTGWTGLPSGAGPNGLGIAAGGTAVYAYYSSSYSSTSYDAQIISYVPSTGTWTTSGLPFINTGVTSAPGGQKSVHFVTGAVDLSTGDYMLSGFDSSGKAYIYKWTPGTPSIVYVGSFATGINDSLNGDIALDKAGNLYVLGSEALNAYGYPTNGSSGWGGNGPITQASMNIFVVTAAQLNQALNNPGGTIVASKATSKTISSTSGFNGISFDGDGSVWVSSSAQILNFNASNWVQNGIAKDITSSNSDLASCSSPATLTIQKNVAGRADVSDQFTLSVTNANTAIQPTTTTGSGTGIQANQIGPTPVVSNSTYTFAESMASGSVSALSAYNTTWQCTAPSPYAVNVSGTGTSGSVKIPTTVDPTGAAVTCTFTNTPIPKTGALSITKAFDASVPTGAGAQTANTMFSGTYSCAFNGIQNATGTWSRTGTGAATLTQASGALPTAIPNGSSCSAVETQPSAGSASGLPASWVWGTPQISGSATITAPNTSNITVTNKATQQKGALAITKVFDSSVPSGATGPFSGKYTCSGTSLATATGSWTVNGQGAATLTADQGSASPTALPAGLSCAVTETSPASGSTMGLPNSYVWGTPTISSAVTISVDTTKTVTVTNKATHVMGSVSWNKTDESGHALAGSEWTITPTNPSGAPITVVDNGVHDADSVAGALKVTGLDVGTYSLQESKAPAGYVRSDRTYTFTISVSSTTATVNGGNAIENEQQTPPTLPLTGGLSTDAFIIGGGGLIVLSVAIALIMRRRKAVHV